jgi:iron complex transport system ATP-binding protein
MAPPLLDFRHVTVLRGERPALEDLTLAIAGDEHVAILGPNGSGKSTLIRTMTRECYPLRSPDSSFAMLGQDEWNVFELRRMLGIVAPDPLAHAGEWLTGFDLALSAFFSSTGVWNLRERITESMRTDTTEALERLQALHLADRPVREMSSGEVRRVQIARALVHRPRALLLDEPSANLDLQAQQELREILRALAREGTGLILVTHHLGDIIPEVTRVVLLKGGRIVGDGPTESMLTPARLSPLFGTRVTLTRQDGYYHAW